MKVKITKLHSDATIPKYAKDGDAAMDLTAISCIEINQYNNHYLEYSTGLAMEIPEGYVGLIFPRSSISNKGMILSNSVGVIDSGYRGEIKFRFKVLDRSESWYIPGDRIGQLIIMPYPKVELEEVEELSSSERGTGGFGSSGS